jgi:hypothetical protein
VKQITCEIILLNGELLLEVIYLKPRYPLIHQLIEHLFRVIQSLIHEIHLVVIGISSISHFSSIISNNKIILKHRTLYKFSLHRRRDVESIIISLILKGCKFDLLLLIERQLNILNSCIPINSFPSVHLNATLVFVLSK